MRTLREIENELKRFKDMRSNNYEIDGMRKYIKEYPDDCHLTFQEIEDCILDLFDVKYTMEKNTIVEAEKLLKDKRNKFIERIQDLDKKHIYFSHTIFNWIYSLRRSVYCLNWVFKYDQFDMYIHY
jgi:hypothetical protein